MMDLQGVKRAVIKAIPFADDILADCGGGRNREQSGAKFLNLF
jgi:hypothetical protein